MPTFDLGVTLNALSKAASIEVPLLNVSNMSLNVDLSTRRPKPDGVLGVSEI